MAQYTTKKARIIALASAFVMLCSILGGCSGLNDKQPDYEKETSIDYAMGTVINQTIYADKNGISDVLLDEIVRLEKNVISVRYPDSDISRLNATKEVSDELSGYLSVAEDLADSSSHAFDPGIGKLIRLWDIDGENPHKPTDEEINKTLAEGNNTYDLGAIGKGIACDNVENIIESYNSNSESDSPLIKGALIAVGGSLLVYGQKPDEKPWDIAITNPRKGDERHPVDGKEYTEGDYLGLIKLSNTSSNPVYISTSGDYEKYFEQDGVRYHHILDPSTGYPAKSGLISVTIICDNGLLSDGLSTACFVLGIEKSLPLLKKYNAEAVFVDQNKNITMTKKAAEMFSLLDDSYTIENILT